MSLKIYLKMIYCLKNYFEGFLRRKLFEKYLTKRVMDLKIDSRIKRYREMH